MDQDCVLAKIFRYLLPSLGFSFPYPENSCEDILSSVCQRWSDVLSKSDKLWRRVNLQIPTDKPLPADFFTVLYRIAPAVRDLTVIGDVGNVSTRVLLNFPKFKNVESLQFDVGPHLTPMEWALVVEMFPKLQEFTTCSAPHHRLGDRTLQLFGAGWPNLTAIDIHDCRRLTGAGLIHLVTVANQLQSINLDGIPSVTDRDMDTITRLLSKSLKSIKFGEDQYKLSGLTIQSIAQNCPKLESIFIANRMSIRHLKYLVSLKSLSIHFPMRPAHCEELEDIFCRPFAQLEWLYISHAKHVTDSQLSHIANSCSRLNVLYLSMTEGRYNNRLVTDFGLDQIVNKCKNLTELDIDRFPLLTGSSFIGSRSKLPQLKRLRFSGCTNLDVAAIRAEFAGVRGMRIEVE